MRLGVHGDNAIKGVVTEIVYAGSETRIIARLNEEAQLTLRLPQGEAPPRLGQQIDVSWERDLAVLVP